MMRWLFGLFLLLAPVTVHAAPACDGVTDDTAAINAALVAGGTVTLPAGVCMVNGVTMQSRAILQGAGRYATFLRGICGTTGPVVVTASFSTLKGSNSPAGPSQWAIRDLVIDGNKACRTAGDGLDSYGWDWSLDHVDVANAPGVGIYSEWSIAGGAPPFPPSVTGEPETHLRDVRVYGNGGDGIQWTGPNDSQFSQLLIYVNGGKGLVANSIPTSSPQGLMLAQVHIYHNGSWGFVTNVVVAASDLESETAQSGGGIQVNGGGAIFGAGVWAYNNIGVGLEINSTFQTVVANVVANSNTGDGIHLYGRSALSNVSAFSNGAGGIVFGPGSSGSQVVGGYVGLNGGTGIFIQGSQQIVTGIQAANNGSYGIQVNAGTSDMTLQGSASSNVGAQLALPSLGTRNSIDMRVSTGTGSGTWFGPIPSTNNYRIISSGPDSKAHFVGLQ